MRTSDWSPCLPICQAGGPFRAGRVHIQGESSNSESGLSHRPSLLHPAALYQGTAHMDFEMPCVYFWSCVRPENKALSEASVHRHGWPKNPSKLSGMS